MYEVANNVGASKLLDVDFLVDMVNSFMKSFCSRVSGSREGEPLDCCEQVFGWRLLAFFPSCVKNDIIFDKMKMGATTKDFYVKYSATYFTWLLCIQFPLRGVYVSDAKLVIQMNELYNGTCYKRLCN